MPVSQSWNGSTYTLPLAGDNYGWGNSTTSYLQSLGSAALSLAGGAFVLTGNVDFGPNFGLLVQSLRSRSLTPSLTGVVRLGNTDTVSWRNVGNTADLPLAINGANQLTFNGSIVGSVASVSGTAPVVSSGGATPDISMASASSVVDGYLTSADWSTFNSKVTSVGATSANAAITVTGSPITSSGSLTFTANTFTSVNPGVVNGSGGGVDNYLRADGAWSTPPGQGSAGSDTYIQYNSGGAFGGDADFAWDSTDNILTLGTAELYCSATTALATRTKAGGAASLAAFTASATAGTASFMQINRSRGTNAVPTVVISGDTLGGQSYRGYDGTSFLAGSTVTALTTENWSGTARGTALGLNVVKATTTTFTQVLRMEHNNTNPIWTFDVDTMLRQSGTWRFQSTGGSTWASISDAGIATDVGLKPPAATLATLPAATTAGRVLYVSDANSGVGTIAFSDGTDWIDVRTAVIVA